MRRVLVLFFLVALQGAPDLLACGQRTHVEMARRAVEDFLSRSGEILPGIDRFFDAEGVRVAFYCGAMFPDWGYEGIDPHAAEHTHWREFHESLFAAVSGSLEGEWDLEERKRIAFFLGVVSHGVTDVPWHFSAGERRSFLAEADRIDGADHGISEAGGDLVLFADRGRRVRLDPEELFWPHDLVLAALAADAVETGSEKLSAGVLRMEATWRAAALAAPFAAPLVRRRYRWLAEHLGDYGYGGIRHGAAATAVWARHYYARFLGRHVLQQTPDYGIRSRDLHSYNGCRDGVLAPDGDARPVLLAGGGRSSFVSFDLASVPAGTRIETATLWLFPAETKDGGWVAIDATAKAREALGAGGVVAIDVPAPAGAAVARYHSSEAFGETGEDVALRPLLVVIPEAGPLDSLPPEPYSK